MASGVTYVVEVGWGKIVLVRVSVEIGVELVDSSVTDGWETPVDRPTNVPRTAASTTARISIVITTLIKQLAIRDGQD